ncbi:hypothetical protein JCM9279_003369 [Rhodotorula babjevae]
MAAVPFLYKSITTRAAVAPYFRVEVLGHDLGQHVHELECHSVKPEQVVSLAAALKGLPNLSSITVSSDMLQLLQDGGVGLEQEFLVLAMKSALGRVTSLKIGYALPATVAHALLHVDKLRLGRLVVLHPDSLLPVEDELVAALNSLDGLVDVELDASFAENVPLMQQSLRLPQVRNLTFMCGQEDYTCGYSNGLILAHHVAPSLEVLTFHNVYSVTAGAFAPAPLPHPLLPKLRVLRIIFNESPDFDSLRLDKLPSLKHLHVSNLSGCGDVFPDEASLSTFPPSLRAITIDHNLTLPASPSASLLAKCDELGIRLSTRWHGPSLEYARMRIDDSIPRLGLAHEAPTEDDAADLERLFGWALGRARWLLRIGDGRAMEELAAAALRLRERFAIEHS